MTRLVAAELPAPSSAATIAPPPTSLPNHPISSAVQQQSSPTTPTTPHPALAPPPFRVSLPSGTSASLRYAPDNELLLPSTNADALLAPPRPPVLASKLQEWFGSETGPSVGGPPGPEINVQLQLLSPAGRPLALVSGGLADFWAEGYAQVRSIWACLGLI